MNLNKKITGVKRHECGSCGNVFLHHSSLNKHMKCHTEHKHHKHREKPYKFKKCDKSFSYLQFFGKNERNHGEENYKECGKGYTDKSFLETHKTTHTRNSMNVSNVVKSSVVLVLIENMKELRLRRNFMNVRDVGRSLVI